MILGKDSLIWFKELMLFVASQSLLLCEIMWPFAKIDKDGGRGAFFRWLRWLVPDLRQLSLRRASHGLLRFDAWHVTAAWAVVQIRRSTTIGGQY